MISESQMRYASFVLRQGRSRLRTANQASKRRLNFPISGADNAINLTGALSHTLISNGDFERERSAGTNYSDDTNRKYEELHRWVGIEPRGWLVRTILKISGASDNESRKLRSGCGFSGTTRARYRSTS